jgi:cation transport regulator ChaB
MDADLDLLSYADPEKRPNRLIAFLQRHDRLVTFLAAVLAFTAFLVKEGFREEWKDLVDSVDSAESVFLLRADIHSVDRRLAIHDRDQKDFGDGGAPTHENLIDTWEVTQQWLQYAASSLQSTKGLLDKLDDENGQREQLDNLQKQHDALQASAKTLWKTIYDLASEYQNAHKGKQIKLLPLKVKKQIDDDLLAAAGLYDNASTLSQAVYKEAENQREARSKRYKAVKISAYVLYGILAIVGLIGKLSGVKGLTAQDSE